MKSIQFELSDELYEKLKTRCLNDYPPEMIEHAGGIEPFINSVCKDIVSVDIEGLTGDIFSGGFEH
jgi:hypothetical protein